MNLARVSRFDIKDDNKQFQQKQAKDLLLQNGSRRSTLPYNVHLIGAKKTKKRIKVNFAETAKEKF